MENLRHHARSETTGADTPRADGEGDYDQGNLVCDSTSSAFIYTVSQFVR